MNRVSRTPAEVTQEMKSFITEICTTIGPRPPCSPQERACGQMFEGKLHDLCDEVTLERFVTHPQAYKAGFRLPMILYLLALVFYWGVSWVSLILAGASFLIFFGEMALVYEVIDKLFPAKESVNMVGKIKPSGERKHLLIIGGHLDSNYEFPLMRKLGAYFSLIIAINTILGGVMFILLVIKNLLLLFGAATVLVAIEPILFWIFCGGIPFALLQLLFIISNLPVMGVENCPAKSDQIYTYDMRIKKPRNKIIPYVGRYYPGGRGTRRRRADFETLGQDGCDSRV